MPMRIGEMMVVVRAQDFASRTLHKVSGELAAMSRQQAMGIRGADLARQKRFTQQTLANAKANVQGLRTIQERNRAITRGERITRRVAGAERELQNLRNYRASQIGTWERELRIAKEQLRTAQQLRQIYPRSAISPAQRTGMVQAARSRVSAAEAGLAGAQRIDMRKPIADMEGRLSRLRGISAAAGRQIQFLDSKVKDLGPSFTRAAQSEGVLSQRLSRARTELDSAYRALSSNTRETIRYNQALKAMPINKLHEASRAMTGVGRTMQLTGAIGTVAFGVAANASANFNRQITLAATQTREAGASFTQTAAHADVLSNAILGMMQEFPASAEEMSQAAYDIFSSMDVSFGDGQKLLREFNKVAVAGGVDLVTATNASISVLENFDNKLANTGHVSQTTHDILNRMFAIVRFGRMNFAQLNDMLNSVVPAAKGAGQSFDDVSGAMALLTRHVPSQSRAATGLARLFDVFANRSFQEGMRKSGRAILDVNNNLLPLPEIIGKIVSLHPKGQQLLNFIQTITAVGAGKGVGREFTVQARRALVPLVKNWEEYMRVQGKVTTDQDEFANSFKAMSQTLGIKWQVFMNQLRVLVLYIGQSALPAFVHIGEVIQGWIKHWQNLSQGTRDMIVKIGVFVSVFTLLGGVMLAVLGTIAGLTASIASLSTRFGGTGGAGGAGSLLGRIGMFLKTMRGIAALSAITVGIELIRKGGNWQTLGTILTAAGIGGAFGGKRGAGAGAAIAISVELQRKGGEWGSVLGTIMQAAVTGGLIGGGAPGAIAGGGLAIGVELWVHFNPKGIAEGEAAIKRFEQFQGKVTGQGGWSAGLKALGVDPNTAARIAGQAWRKFEIVNSKHGFEAGRAAAKQYIKAYVQHLVADPKMMQRVMPGLNIDAFAGKLKFAMNLLGISLDDTDKKTKKLTLDQALKGAKSFTELMNIANQQVQDTVSSTEKLAIAISRATARGNFANAARMINKAVEQANEKLTPQNIIKKISDALATGGTQAASGVMEQYIQEAQQAGEQYSQDMKQFHDDTIQWQKDMKARQVDLMKTIKETTDSTIASLTNLYSQLQATNEAAFGALFQGPVLTGESFDLAKEWGVSPGINDIIHDITAQTNQFKERRKDIDILFKRGLPKGFLDELKKMSPEEAMPILRKLVKATPGETARLIRVLKTRGKLIKNATKLDFGNEIASFKKAGVSMAEAIKMGFDSGGVGPWFAGWIKSRFPNIINTAVNQAVKDFKLQHPIPVAPKAPVKPDYTVTGKNKVIQPPPAQSEKHSVAKQNNNVYHANIYIRNANLVAKVQQPTNDIGQRPRVLGGNVINKNTYLVGERGPELFVPNRSGRIISNRQLRAPTAGIHGPPLFTDEGPQYYQAAYKHNRPFAQGAPYRTMITGAKEKQFRAWVKQWGVWFQPNARISDYDMRGFWQWSHGAPHKQGTHFVDLFKTPYDTSFSHESKYATRNNPFYWKGDRLIDTRNGQIVFQAPEKRFLGGIVKRGKKYLVGEHGAEMYTSGAKRAWKWYSNEEHRANVRMHKQLSAARSRGGVDQPVNQLFASAMDKVLSPVRHTPHRGGTSTTNHDNSTHIEVNYNVHASDVPSRAQARHDAFMIANSVRRAQRSKQRFGMH